MRRTDGWNRIRDNLFPWLVILAFVFGMFILTGYARMGADDFFYACFWDGGLSGFADMTVTHFFESSGRVFVHLFCSSVLWLGMPAYQVVATLLVATLAILAGLVFTSTAQPDSGEDANRVSLRRFSWSVAFFCAGFACLGLGLMREAVLWNAGLFNYLFPVWLQLLYFHLLRQDLIQKRSSRVLWSLAFFCGATVEQTGILVIFTSLALIGSDAIRLHRRPRIWHLICVLSGSLGYATLFFSPGVTERLDKNQAFTGLPVYQKIMGNLPVVARMVVGEGGIGFLLSLVLILGLMVLIGHMKTLVERIAGAIGILGVVLLLWMTSTLFLISDRVVVATSVVAFLALLCLCLWFWKEGEVTGACFVSFGLLSASVLLVSPVLGMRMLFPAGVFFLIAICRFAFLILWTEKEPVTHSLRRWVPGILFAALLLLAVLNQMDIHAGYARNEPVLQANIDKTLQAAATGASVLVLEAIPDERYGYENVPVNWNFTEWYIRYYHLPEDARLSVADPSGSPLRVQGQRLPNGVVVRDDTAYVPLRGVFEAMGYKVSWKQSSAVIESGKVAFLFKAASSVVRIQQPSGSFTLRLDAPVRNIHTQIYVPLDFVVKTFGGKLERVRNEYVLTY